MSVHFSSATDDWNTPPAFFAKMVERFGEFDLDPAATHENAKAKRYYIKEDNGLERDWGGLVWLNPPYGRTIGLWMAKAVQEAAKGAIVVCLIPARTDTKWWHEYVMKGEIEFIRGRLKFGNAKHSAPFSSALVVFRP